MSAIDADQLCLYASADSIAAIIPITVLPNQYDQQPHRARTSYSDNIVYNGNARHHHSIILQHRTTEGI